MSQNHDAAVQRFTYLSRRFMYSFALSFCLLGVIEIFLLVLGIGDYWLEIIDVFFSVIAGIYFAVSLIMPGVLIVLGVPWLAQAWLRGMYPVTIWKTPWEQSSGFQKFLIYILSILLSSCALLGIVAFLLENLRK